MASAGAVKAVSTAALLAAGAALSWQIIATGVGASLQDSHPANALTVQPNNAVALANLSDRALADGAFDRARNLARQALLHGPVEETAYRVLGQAAASTGQMALARQFMVQAGALSLRDTDVAYWLYREELVAGRYPGAFLFADALMRRTPSIAPSIVPDLVRATADPAALKPLAERLSANPTWRQAFFLQLGRNAPSYENALTLAHALSGGAAPVTDIELSRLLGGLTRAGRYEDAYRAWLSFLPTSKRPVSRTQVVNGDFNSAPGATPFSWTVGRFKGGETTLDPAVEGPGLNVRFSGLSEVEAARQMMMLAPGLYRLTSKAHLEEGLESALEWRVVCAVNGGLLGRAPLAVSGSMPGATDATFEIPSDCPAQYLALRIKAGDRGASARPVIDSVQIARLEGRP